MDEKWLTEVEFYKHLSENEKQMILTGCVKKQVKAGDLIYSPSRECIGVILVQSGIARTYLLSEEGKKATIYRFRSGEVCVFSMSCTISAITFDVEIEAEEDCELIIFPTDLLSKIGENNLYIENYIYKTATQSFSYIIEAVEQILFMTLEQRVVSFLLDETSVRKTNVLMMTQEQLAENIGSAREAVSRVLKNLGGQQMIEVTRGKIELLDKQKMYRIL